MSEPSHDVHIRNLEGRIDEERMRHFMYDMVDSFIKDCNKVDPYMRWPNLNSLAFDFATFIRCLHNAYGDEASVISFIRTKKQIDTN